VQVVLNNGEFNQLDTTYPSTIEHPERKRLVSPIRVLLRQGLAGRRRSLSNFLAFLPSRHWSERRVRRSHSLLARSFQRRKPLWRIGLKSKLHSLKTSGCILKQLEYTVLSVRYTVLSVLWECCTWITESNVRIRIPVNSSASKYSLDPT
jgi:hypothetical protein